MSYEVVGWQNEPSTATALSAENLNHMDQGIYDAHQGLNELQGLAYGPLKAATVADMTDQTRVYVYTGSEAGYVSGNWYYYDGSAWVSGGVYNAVAISTDKTLSISDKAADAKATGDAVSAINSALSKKPNGKRTLNICPEEFVLGTFVGGALVNSSTRIRSKAPIPVEASTTYYFVCSQKAYIMSIDAATNWTQSSTSLVAKNSTFTTPAYAAYIYVSPVEDYGTTYKDDMAIYKGSEAKPYRPYIEAIDYDARADLDKKPYYLTTAETIATPFDFNDITTPGSYCYSNLSTSTHKPPTTSGSGVVKVEQITPSNTSNLRQTVIAGAGESYVRYKVNNSWGDWTKEVYYIERSTLTAPIDFDSVKTAGLYAIPSFTGATNPPPTSAGSGYMEIKKVSDSVPSNVMQIVTDARGSIFVREYISSAWSAWKDYSQTPYLLSLGYVLSGVDFNDYISPGSYYLSSSSGSSNMPPNTGGCILRVEKITPNGTNCKQTVVSGQGVTYKRYYLSNSWTEWKQEPLEETNTLFQFNPDSIVKNQMEQLNRKRTLQTSTYDSTPPLVLTWFSDIHANYENLSRIAAFNAKYSSLIRDSICTGDMFNTSVDESFTWWDSNGGTDIMMTVGNHDMWGQTGNRTLNAKETYDLLFKDRIADWGVTYQTDKCYYYKDYTDCQIRLVVIDCMHWDSDQSDWLDTTLEGAKSAGYYVLLASHYFGGEHTGITCAFESIEENPATFLHYTDSAVKQAIDNFITSGGNFVCWITGHTHRDQFTILDDTEGQLNIVVECATNNYSYTDEKRVSGEKSQDAFNVLSIDRTFNEIRILRIGSDYDGHLRHKGILYYRFKDFTDINGITHPKGLLLCE